MSVVLQATDELVSRGCTDLPHFSVRIASLAAYAKAQPDTVLVDSLDKLQQVSRAVQYSITVQYSIAV